MNILFLCLGRIQNINSRGIYTDLLREFISNGDDIYMVSPVERKYKKPTQLLKQEHAQILKVKTLNIQKTNILEKGLGTFLIEWQFLHAIKKYFRDVHFDLVLYATPPITMVKPIEYIKKRDHAKTYLLLKDIFPQNAIDIGMMTKTGVKGILYRVFRRKEKRLYAVSDTIGCMSPANVNYVLQHNPEVDKSRVEICPNSVSPLDRRISPEERLALRQKYEIPTDKTVFVYGGNLGKPQSIPFLIDALRACRERQDAYFLIVGDGTEFGKLAHFVNTEQPQNVKLLKRLPKEDYDRLVAACDVGMIFLDRRFTIPNFPSRLLSYMQAGLPVLACTDVNTDVGKIATEGGFGWWCESRDAKDFVALVDDVLQKGVPSDMSDKEFAYLQEHYSVAKGYSIIKKHLQ